MEHFTRNTKIHSKTHYLQEMSKSLFTHWYEFIVFDIPVLQSYFVISLSFLYFVVLCL